MKRSRFNGSENLKSLQANDATAWEELDRLIRSSLKKSFQGRLSREDLEDLVQKILLSVHIQIDKFQNLDSIISYIYRIAHNDIIDKYRKNNVKTKKEPYIRFKLQENYVDSIYNMNPENIYKFKEVEGILQKEIEGLSENFRVALKNHFMGKSQKEISILTGISPNTLAVFKFRFTEKVKKLLVFASPLVIFSKTKSVKACMASVGSVLKSALRLTLPRQFPLYTPVLTTTLKLTFLTTVLATLVFVLVRSCAPTTTWIEGSDRQRSTSELTGTNPSQGASIPGQEPADTPPEATPTSRLDQKAPEWGNGTLSDLYTGCRSVDIEPFHVSLPRLGWTKEHAVVLRTTPCDKGLVTATLRRKFKGLTVHDARQTPTGVWYFVMVNKRHIWGWVKSQVVFIDSRNQREQDKRRVVQQDDPQTNNTQPRGDETPETSNAPVPSIQSQEEDKSTVTPGSDDKRNPARLENVSQIRGVQLLGRLTLSRWQELLSWLCPPELDYNPQELDGQQLEIRFACQSLTSTYLPSMLIRLIVEFVDQDDTVVFTLSERAPEGGFLVKHNAVFEDTIVGVAMMIADVMLAQSHNHQLVTDAMRHATSPWEEEFNNLLPHVTFSEMKSQRALTTVNRLRREVERQYDMDRVERLRGMFRSIPFDPSIVEWAKRNSRKCGADINGYNGDRDYLLFDHKVNYVATIQNGKLHIAGRPYYYYWYCDPIAYGEPVARPIDQIRMAEVYQLNPHVYETVILIAQWSAVFRTFKALNPEAWRKFKEKIQIVPVGRVKTPPTWKPPYYSGGCYTAFLS